MPSDVYLVQNIAEDNVAEGLQRLIASGLNLYSIISENDVVVLKVSAQWRFRGHTNTDLVRAIIEAINAHPNGFTGEIIIADNAQYRSTEWPSGYAGYNAFDTTQTFQVVADLFPNVSIAIWDDIQTAVQEFSDGDLVDGYVELPADPSGAVLNYPKFTSALGTPISLRNGVWNGTSYEDRLRLINLGLLKTHATFMAHGVTGCVKNYMGVVSQGLAYLHGGSPDYISQGLLGQEMVDVKFPDLNILDCIWVNPHPHPLANAGPRSYYGDALYVGALFAGVDPVAIDYIGATSVLMPNCSDPTYINSMDPDYAGVVEGLQGTFHDYLVNSMDRLVLGGFQATMNPAEINVIEQALDLMTIGVDNPTGYIGDTFTFSGELTRDGAPLEGILVELFRDGTRMPVPAVTNASGQYAIPWISDIIGNLTFHSEANP